MSGFGGGLAGLGPNNSFHEPASWVDQSKPPGHTSTSPRTGQKGWWYSWPDHSYVPIGVLGLGQAFAGSGRIAGPALAGVVFASIGIDWPFFFGAAAMILMVFGSRFIVVRRASEIGAQNP